MDKLSGMKKLDIFEKPVKSTHEYAPKHGFMPVNHFPAGG